MSPPECRGGGDGRGQALRPRPRGRFSTVIIIRYRRTAAWIAAIDHAAGPRNLGVIVTGENWLADEEAGFIEHTNKTVEPASLYRAQLADRLAPLTAS